VSFGHARRPLRLSRVCREYCRWARVKFLAPVQKATTSSPPRSCAEKYRLGCSTLAWPCRPRVPCWRNRSRLSFPSTFCLFFLCKAETLSWMGSVCDKSRSTRHYAHPLFSPRPCALCEKMSRFGGYMRQNPFL